VLLEEAEEALLFGQQGPEPVQHAPSLLRESGYLTREPAMPGWS
jgi:hypothetical protein